MGRNTSITIDIDPNGIFYFMLQAKLTNSKGVYYSQWSQPKFYPYNPFIQEFFDIPDLLVGPWHGYLYKISTKLTLGWDATDNATYYNVQVVLDETTPTTFSYSTNTNSIELDRPSNVGIYYAMIQACNDYGCSEWTSSDSEEGLVTVNGEQTNGNFEWLWDLYSISWVD